MTETPSSVEYPAPVSDPKPSSKSISSLNRLPTSIIRILSSNLRTTNTNLLALDKLLTSQSGLSAFLSTTNYALYILSYLSRPTPSLTKLRNILLRQHPPSKLTSSSPSFSLTDLTSLIVDLRITLRLFSLPTYYTWVRSLLLTPPSTTPDPLTHYINLVQSLSYLLFQILENVAHLHDKKILTIKSPRLRGSTEVWLWSSRFWTLGLACEFARLTREAILSNNNNNYYYYYNRQKQQQPSSPKTSSSPANISISDIIINADQAQKTKRWYQELQTAACWFPIAVHYSLENGIKGLNGGAIGVLGLLAEIKTLKTRWRGAKKEVM
ncbi:putative glutamyl-trna amidotransferase subunit a [Phaeomoniella chlamydospora]|uniref:Putative glutamyl-trna amidotransferase subunit a n=1 Tax=Phaeomoniella chlamydospora TaxID=158046 RepID=A0A0G2GBZ1_PHACM|nr:putative glutamyl-trna amidotransferase subunit a [Phaeomoniella chlamydospora]